MMTSGVDPDSCDGVDLPSFEDEVKIIATTRKMPYVHMYYLSEHPHKNDSYQPINQICAGPTKFEFTY